MAKKEFPPKSPWRWPNTIRTMLDRARDRGLAEGGGWQRQQIVADHLAISEDTVKAHMRSILSKLGANDRTHAVTIAVKRGIIDI